MFSLVICVPRVVGICDGCIKVGFDERVSRLEAFAIEEISASSGSLSDNSSTRADWDMIYAGPIASAMVLDVDIWEYSRSEKISFYVFGALGRCTHA